MQNPSLNFDRSEPAPTYFQNPPVRKHCKTIGLTDRTTLSEPERKSPELQKTSSGESVLPLPIIHHKHVPFTTQKTTFCAPFFAKTPQKRHSTTQKKIYKIYRERS
jgi:hypothetical protein